jgi:hypothetical protein
MEPAPVRFAGQTLSVSTTGPASWLRVCAFASLLFLPSWLNPAVAFRKNSWFSAYYFISSRATFSRGAQAGPRIRNHKGKGSLSLRAIWAARGDFVRITPNLQARPAFPRSVPMYPGRVHRRNNLPLPREQPRSVTRGYPKYRKANCPRTT